MFYRNQIVWDHTLERLVPAYDGWTERYIRQTQLVWDQPTPEDVKNGHVAGHLYLGTDFKVAEQLLAEKRIAVDKFPHKTHCWTCFNWKKNHKEDGSCYDHDWTVTAWTGI